MSATSPSTTPSPEGRTRLSLLVDEATRQLDICNACRYCEGLCAVFPALSRRTVLTAGDVSQLANLCHDCRACYDACMYTAPHEFGVNPPAVLGEIRRATYGRYIRPPRLPGWLAGRGPPARAGRGRGPGRRRDRSAGGTHRGARRAVGADPPAGFAVRRRPLPRAAGDRGAAQRVEHRRHAAGGRALLARHARTLRDLAHPGALGRALAYAARLRYLRGGGEECFYPQDVPSPVRRHLHAATFYGFAACFAATVSAAVMQDFLGLPPPYPALSAPVILGTGGGVAIIAGCTGLIVLKRRSDPLPGAPGMAAADYGLLVALTALAGTGLLTLLLRTTGAFGLLLVIHLTTIAVCLGLAPYTKFVHFIYRFLAIVADNIEAARAG